MVVAIILNVMVSFGKECLKQYRDVAITLVVDILFWLGTSPFLVIIGAGLAGIFLFKGLAMGADGKETNNLFHVKQVLIALPPLIASFLALYTLNKRFFEIVALMMKVDLFAFGGGLCKRIVRQ